MGKYFGTDGIRGEANTRLTPEFILKLGKAAAYRIMKKKQSSAMFLVARDTRISGDMIEGALLAGITSMGCNVLLTGVIPTPAAAYLVRFLDLDCAVVISASHNPVKDNGIKFFSRQGYKFTSSEEAEIEALLEEGIPPGNAFLSPRQVGRAMILTDAGQRYANHVESRARRKLNGLKIIVDCANGSTSKIAPEILSDLGARVVVINGHPTGTNINLDCGSTHPQLLQKMVVSGEFDAGLAFDGDGDRVIAVDEKGNLIDGDQLMNIFGLFYSKHDQLPKNTIVATVMSNVGLELSLKEAGISLLRTGVGDRLVLEKMKQTGATIGGEQSGHIIFLEDNTTGDGIITSIHLLSIMKQTDKKLSELAGWMTRYPQVLKNVEVKDKSSILQNSSVKSFIEKVKNESPDDYRIVIRPSGTEPKIRVMVEGSDHKTIEKIADKICKKIRDVSGS